MSGRTLRARTLRFAPVLAAVTVVALVNVVAAQSPSTEPGASPAAAPSGLNGAGVKIGLITKDNTNPFFVKMHEGAQAEADLLGAELTYAAGRDSSDVDSQIAAIESMVSA